LLAGCSGSSGEPEAQVASLPTSAAASTETATGTEETPGSTKSTGKNADSGTTAGRPQMRLDDTQDRRDAMIAAWDACLVKNGARYAPDNGRAAAGAAAAPGQDGTGKVLRQVQDPIPQAAKTACMNKLPQLPVEFDPNLNPHYRDNAVTNVKCLREHGIKVHLTKDTSVDPNGLGWTYDDNAPPMPDNSGQIEHDCELAAYGGKS